MVQWYTINGKSKPWQTRFDSLVTEENLFGQLAVEHLVRVPQTPGHGVLGKRFSVEQWHDDGGGGGGGEIIKSRSAVKRNRRLSVRLRMQLPLMRTRWSRATTGRPAADRCLGGPLSARATSRTVSAASATVCCYLPARVVSTAIDGRGGQPISGSFYATVRRHDERVSVARRTAAKLRT